MKVHLAEDGLPKGGDGGLVIVVVGALLGHLVSACEGVEEVGVLGEVVAEGVEAQGPRGEGEEEGRVGGEGGLPRGGGDPEAAGGGALGDRSHGRGRRRHLLVVVGGAGARARAGCS